MAVFNGRSESEALEELLLKAKAQRSEALEHQRRLQSLKFKAKARDEGHIMPYLAISSHVMAYLASAGPQKLHRSDSKSGSPSYVCLMVSFLLEALAQRPEELSFWLRVAPGGGDTAELPVAKSGGDDLCGGASRLGLQ